MAYEWDSPSVGSEASPPAAAAPVAPSVPSVPVNATHLVPSEEKKYQDWKTTLPDRLQYEGDYDLRGFWRKNPKFSVDVPGQHMTDEFKLPNHPTFSNESRYYNDKTKHLGGHWMGDVYIPNDTRYKQMVDESEGASPADPPPAFLTKRPKGAPKYEWDAAPAEDAPAAIAPSRPLNNAGPDLSGQVAREAEREKAREEARGLVARAKALFGGSKDVATDAGRAVLGRTTPRPEFERGISDAIAAQAAPVEAPGAARSVWEGFKNAASFGFGDEIGAGLERAKSLVTGHGADEPTYAEHRDALRAVADRAQSAHPLAFGTGAAAGSLPTALVPAGAVPATLAGRIAAGAAAGYAQNALQGAGNSTADLTQGDVGGLARDAEHAGEVGAVLGGVAPLAGAAVSAIGEKLAPAAQKRVVKQAVSDIIGTRETGRAVDTDIKKMGRAIEPIRAELRTTDGLAMADTARTDPDAALGIVKQKLRDITKDRNPDYQAVDTATGSVRAGDFVDHLENSIKSLTATGQGKDAAIAAELKKSVERIKNAGDWGAPRGPTLDMNAPYDSNYTVGQYIDLMKKVGQQPAQARVAQQEIARVHADPRFHQPTAWNPDAVVPTERLRDFVTDMQSTAYDNLGSINGTNAFKKAREVAHVGEEFLNKHLDDAEKKGATEAVQRIREMNRRVNAYATIRDALDTRVGKVDTAEMKMSPSTKTELGVGGVLTAMGHPGLAVSGLAAKKLLPPLVGAADRGISRSLASRAPVAGLIGNPAPLARIGAQANTGRPQDRAIAQIIQGAQGGKDPAELLRFANDNGVDPRLADSIIKRYAAQPVSP